MNNWERMKAGRLYNADSKDLEKYHSFVTKLTTQSETVLLTEERFFSLVLRNRLRILSRTKLRDVECTM